MNPIQNYLEELIDRCEQLEIKEYTIPEFTQQLNILDYQVYLLIKEKTLFEVKKSKPAKINVGSIKKLKDAPLKFINLIPFSVLELQTITGVPFELIAKLIDHGYLNAYRKKRRKGHVRSLFKFKELFQNQNKIMDILSVHYEETAETDRINNINSDELENSLLTKIQHTAKRLAHDNLSGGLKNKEKKKNEYELDLWQKNAILAVEAGKNIFVQAPTGAGKTAIVEEYISRNIENGLTLFYAVPIKALANDKFFDFCELYGNDNVGINTGDITLNGSAPIIVGTTEIVRNIIFDNPEAYKTIAYDEAQYLGDPERGGAWEESIILCDDDTKLIFLSGSVSNAESVASWVSEIKNVKTDIFSETVRPVPLQFAFPYDNGYIKQEDWYDLQSLARKNDSDMYSEKRFFEQIEKSDMTPVLLFMARRRDCEDILTEISPVSKESSEEMRKILEEHPEYKFVNLRLRNLLVKKRIAYHHSGLLPPEKRVVETFAKKGLLRFVSATMSLASGVNFSVRTCFINEYRRPGNGGMMQDLSPSEILQMWGRAGRRGLDTEGYLIPCMNVDHTDNFKRIKAYPEAIERTNFVSPVNLLSILSRYSVGTLEKLCEKSFSSYVENVRYRSFSDETMKREAGAICASPTYELPPYRQAVYANTKRKKMEEMYNCTKCPNLDSCTRTYEKDIKYNPLQKMIKHLKINNYLTPDFNLTQKGKLAERFHSEAGLLVAHHIVEGKVNANNILHYAATVSAPGHIDFTGSRKRLQLDIAKKIYPNYLFPNLWERQRGRMVFVNWNPGAGVIADKWLKTENWEDFSKKPALAKIQGDIFRVLLRSGELLKSIGFIKDLNPELAQAAIEAHKKLMKPPLIPENLFNHESS
jgi:superfamily II RNA helicase